MLVHVCECVYGRASPSLAVMADRHQLCLRFCASAFFHQISPVGYVSAGRPASWTLSRLCLASITRHDCPGAEMIAVGFDR